MKVNSISNVNFNARLGGELKKVIDISTSAGLSKSGVSRLLNEVQRLLPSKKDKVNFYFREYAAPEHSFKNPTIRSSIKVVKDNKVMELNINPRKFQPRDLLQEMVIGVKRLVSGETKPDEKAVFYDKYQPKSWINFFQEESSLPQQPWLKNYEDSFKKC